MRKKFIFISNNKKIQQLGYCIYMEDTGKLKVQNYPCKGNIINCSHPEVDEQASIFMSTKLCNKNNCKYYTSNNE